MPQKKRFVVGVGVIHLILVCGMPRLWGADLKALPGHVPKPVANLTALSELPSSNELHLAIGLPMRDHAGLDKFVADVYDPHSPLFHHYLTPIEIADRFGPTEQDYQQVLDFARSNGLQISKTYGNRLLVDVTGPAGSVEKAFHITLRTFRHPTEARNFFAPDTEPSVDATLPVSDIQGLSDFYRPRPLLASKKTSGVHAAGGSSPDGLGGYFGNDFVNAYAPGVPLQGAGQNVGLLEFDSFYSNDIATYASEAGGGRANIAIQEVLIGVSGLPGYSGILDADAEVSLDIEMAIALDPGLASVQVFEGSTQNSLLNTMLSYSSTVKTMSSSWSWSGGPSPTTDIILESMGAAGQSFFQASGDSDAYTTGANSVNGVDNTGLDTAPVDSIYVTSVGATTLTTTNSGPYYFSETVWNWGYDANAGQYIGSSGGISSYYAMPSWQTNVSNMAARGGSPSYRNIPDVAMAGDNIYVAYGNGTTGEFGGTSCAAPLWAAFTALVNQQCAANNRPSVGFLNPALYTLAITPSYNIAFHDVTTGNNTSSDSPNLFYATNGYDLCTGLGTPNGLNLITLLGGPPDSLVINPLIGFSASGPPGGPFANGSESISLSNSSSSSITWTTLGAPTWLNVSPPSGVLAAGQQISVTAALSQSSSNLAIGSYTGNVVFSNETTGISQTCGFALQVLVPVAISPVKGFVATATIGGSFSQTSETFVLTNLSGTKQVWSIASAPSWLNVTPTNGILPGLGQGTITATLNSSVNSFTVQSNAANLVITNPSGWNITLPFALQVSPLLINGGFETGDFTGWNLFGSTTFNYVTSTSEAPDFVHSGKYAAALGQTGGLGFLYQTLPTTPGQTYFLSLWFAVPRYTGGSSYPNQFEVMWNGTMLYNKANIPFIGWTNIQYFVTATSSSTTLEFGFEDVPYYMALDDISVTPLIPPNIQPQVASASAFNVSAYALSGFQYQFEYATNLANPVWINVGQPISPTNGIVTFSDPNFRSNPARFYRLQLIP